MKRNLISILIFTAVLLTAGLAIAKEKEGPMAGTWSCQAKGGPEGDMAFTLYLEQNAENVDGSVSSPIGSARITSGTFKHDMLEIHIDTEDGNYVLMAKFEKGALSGTWTHESDKGTWEGKKEATASH
ncbi:MAG TPA: hypothetical protein VKO18_07280 [Terriglobia bacterium]|nr:hypothetical protein [Terriglobia bacterium]